LHTPTVFGYADDVWHVAKNKITDKEVPDTRLMQIDYSTHTEVLVANLLLGSNAQVAAILEKGILKGLHSFRCVLQLDRKKEIKISPELEGYRDCLKSCATCYDYDEYTDTYIYDFLVDNQVKKAFKRFWDNNSLKLYSSLHKFAMLNNLILSKKIRENFEDNFLCYIDLTGWQFFNLFMTNFGIQMGVSLCRSYVRMTKISLNFHQAGSVLHKVTCKSVSE